MENTKDTKGLEKLFDGVDIESISTHYQLKETKEFDEIVTEFYKIHNASPFKNIEMKEDAAGKMTGEVDIEMEEGFEKTISKKFDEPGAVIGDYLSAIMMVIADSKDSELTNND